MSHLDGGLRPLLSHGSTAPLADFGLWAVVSAAVRGDQDRGPCRVARRIRCCSVEPIRARWRMPTRSWPAGARTPTRPRGCSRRAANCCAATPWWARFLRLITLEAAIADGWGDPVPQLRADLAAYETGGDIALGRICRELLRRAGAETRRGRGDSAGPAATCGPLGVTSRELDVLRLIEAGLTNAAISEQLFLSPRTIETHVTNLLAKSGSANRQELRAWYLRQT